MAITRPAPIQFAKRTAIARDRDELRRTVVPFWQERRMRFGVADGTVLTAHRGSVLGNILAIDSERVCTELVVDLAIAGQCTCTLTVNPWFHRILDWDRACWLLELETLESVLLTGDLREAERAWLRRANRAAFWRSMFSDDDDDVGLPPELEDWPQTRHPEFEWGAVEQRGRSQ